MTATYFRYGRGQSINSIIAKNEGRAPLSYFANGKKAAHIKAAAEFLDMTPSEYHHTGKYASKTTFWDAHTIAKILKALPDAKALEVARAKRESRDALYGIWQRNQFGKRNRDAQPNRLFKFQSTGRNIVTRAWHWRLRGPDGLMDYQTLRTFPAPPSKTSYFVIG